MIKKIESGHLSRTEAPQASRATVRSPFMTAMVGCACVFVASIALSAAPISTIAGINLSLWFSVKLTRLGKWLPGNLGLAKDYYVSRQDTGYLELMLLLAVTFIAYGVCALLVNRKYNYRSSHMMGLIWLVALVGGCIYLFTPGILASDIYSYDSYGRILAIHLANPYFVRPSAFPKDPTLSLLYWKDTVTIYGPVWTAVSALLASIAGTGQFRIIFLFRLFAFAAHLVNILLVSVILRNMNRQSEHSERVVLTGTLLYAWNPLVLSESALGGHNDVFMLTFILLGVLLCILEERRWRGMEGLRLYAPAVIAFTLAALVKFSAVPVIAAFILMLFFKTLRSTVSMDGGTGAFLRWRQAIGTALITSLISAGVTLILYAPFWIGHNFTAIVNSVITTPSAVTAFNSLLFSIDTLNGVYPLPPALAFLMDHHFWNDIAIIAMGLPLIIGAIVMWRVPATANVRTMVLMALASLAGFLIVTPWFFAWYVTWIVGLAVVCLPVVHTRLRRGLVAFTLALSATAFLSYYSTLIGWLLLTYRPPQVGWIVPLYGVMLVVPLLAFLIFCLSISLRRRAYL